MIYRNLCRFLRRNYATEPFQIANIHLKDAFKLHELKSGPPPTTFLTKQQAQLYYEQMVTIRCIESVASSLYGKKIMRGFCQPYAGQEACAVGMKAVMEKTDHIITAQRCHGWSCLMGVSPYAMLAELTGRQGGKSGSTHMYSPHYYGGSGSVGAQVPLGTGIAFALKYRNDKSVCLTCYGDGSANQGKFFESYNIASMWRLPVIYVCECNQYGEGTTSTERASFNHEFYIRGHHMPGISVNGIDILAVRSATEFARRYALENGPIIIETSIYRYPGHSMPDSKEIQDILHKNDPIVQFKKLCITNRILREQEMMAINERVKSDVDLAADEAKKRRVDINLGDLTVGVYSKCLVSKIRGTVDYNLSHVKANQGGVNI